MQYLGDFSEDATVYIPFNTFSSDDPQSSVTITNLVAADIKVHKDGSVTQIVTDGATVAIDFDTITGNHLITIDTSAHADYSVGSDYLVRIEGTTVDAGTINAFVGSFSIENRFNEVDVTKWLGTAAATPTTAGVPEVDVTFVSGTAQTANDNGADINAILLDTAEIGTAGAGLTNLGGSSNNWNVGKTGYSLTQAFPSNFADLSITITTGRVDIASVAGTAQTGNDNGADINAILADTNDLQTNQGNWLTATGFATDTKQDTMETTLNDVPTTAEFEARTLAAASYFDPAADTVATVTSVTNEVTADITKISGSATAADNLEASALGVVPGACEGTPSTTVIQTDLAEATDDHYIGRIMVFTSGNAAGEASDITDYTGATGTCTVTAVTTAPAATDTFVIV